MTAAPPVLVVAGLGRCGSSLTMQMLAAGGVRCCGTFPDYEEQPTMEGDLSSEWLAPWRGAAVKILDPQRLRFSDDVPTVVVWLSRNLRQQTLSQIKFAQSVFHLPPVGRAHARRWEAGLRGDERAALARLRPARRLRYEEILDDPELAARRLFHVCVDARIHVPHRERMAAAVRKRDPRCAPDLSMELALIAEAEAA